MRIAQRTGTHDEILGGQDQALGGVDGYNTNETAHDKYQKNSEVQPLTLTMTYLTSTNTGAKNHPSATINYYHCDQIGTPRGLTDELGAVTWSATYKAWGRVEKEQSYQGLSLAASDGQAISDFANAQLNAPAQASQNHQPVRFQGQYYDDETGLHYNRFRYFEPETGRYLSSDPIGMAGGVNTYRYVSNPNNEIDPNGLKSVHVRNWEVASGQTLPSGYQVHHIIPQALESEAKKLCPGFDIHSASNLIALPTSSATSPPAGRYFGSTVHFGSHPGYSAAVKGALTAARRLNVPGVSPCAKLEALKEMLRAQLQSGTVQLNGAPSGMLKLDWLSALRNQVRVP